MTDLERQKLEEDFNEKYADDIRRMEEKNFIRQKKMEMKAIKREGRKKLGLTTTKLLCYYIFIMFNVYAQRATRPDDMEPELNPTLHAENKKAFAYLLSLSEEPAVWAAWGNIIEKRDYLPDCVQELVTLGQQVNARWFTAGPLLKSGHPHHPLYLRRDTALIPFDADAYYAAQQLRIAEKSAVPRRGRRKKTERIYCSRTGKIGK